MVPELLPAPYSTYKLTSMKRTTKLLLGFLLLGFVFLGCDKTKLYDVKEPDGQATFLYVSSATYIMNTANDVYRLKIGTTNVSDHDRNVTISVSSPTGASQGTQYTLSKTSVLIPAGKTIDSIDVKGIFAQYTAGRKDSLVFTISGGDVSPSSFNSTFKLLLRGPCFDGDVTLSTMAGSYPNSTDPDDPVYTATVTNISGLTATTGTGKIGNLWNWFTPVTINFDWTDPNNPKVSIPLRDAGQVYAAGQPFLIRTSPGQTNKFSVCNGRINLIVDLIVDNYFGPGQGAYYEQNYPMTIKR
jgi:hypothetical protein